MCFSKIASLLFGIVTIVHLLRFIFNIEVTVENVLVPMRISILGFIVPAVLSVGLWKETNRKM